MADSVAVVIPFYQKKPGILTKAIVSALAQTGVAPCTIIVVDDASPVSARSELADIMRDHPGRIVIIEQANAGPAAARNKGLDSVPAGTEYVAYLDSDDEWIDSHLANAMVALGAGYDFYFSDLYQLNQSVSAFNRAARIKVQQHAPIAGIEHLRAYSGDMFDQILMGNVIGTPTVVYRYAKFPALRFREEFVYAGEDYLFWLELSQQTSKIAFSSQCECICGEGVNIFAGSGWGTEKSLIRLHHELKYKKALPRLFALNETQLGAIRSSVKTLQRSFVADVLHRLARRKPVGVRFLIKHFLVDPQFVLHFIPIAVALKLGRRVS
jgi:succinoglycan biosynthesis protein ExoW